MTDTDARTGQIARSAAEVYEEFFVPALFAQWPEHLLAAGGWEPGDDLLDVGCGTGVLASAAASRARDRGTVAGVDRNAGMLAVARHAHATVQWHEAPAERLPFRDQSFDVVASQFAAMFFDDAPAAIDEMYRVARRRVVVATWAGLDRSPGYAAMVELLRRTIGDAAADALSAPFCLGTEESVRALVERSTPPRPVVVATVQGTARFASLDAWLHTDVRGWTLGGMIDDERFAVLRSAALTELAPFVGSDGRVEFPAPAIIATCDATGRSPV